MKISQEDEILI